MMHIEFMLAIERLPTAWFVAHEALTFLRISHVCRDVLGPPKMTIVSYKHARVLCVREEW